MKPAPPDPNPVKKQPPKGMTRKAFGELLKRAITPRGAKPSPK